MKTRTQIYRGKRNVRILEALSSELGDAFEPMPTSNRQFEALASILKKVTRESGVDAPKLAQIWADSLRQGAGKPATIWKVYRSGVVKCGESVEQGVEQSVEQTDVEAPVPANVPLKAKDLSRIMKLDCTLIVLSDLGNILQVVKESGDLDMMVRLKEILNKVVDLADSKYDIIKARTPLAHLITDLKREEAA